MLECSLTLLNVHPLCVKAGIEDSMLQSANLGKSSLGELHLELGVVMILSLGPLLLSVSFSCCCVSGLVQMSWERGEKKKNNENENLRRG